MNKVRLSKRFFKTMNRLYGRRNSLSTPRPAKLTAPFFIVGSGRNGSTLMGSMLNKHPKIHLAAEQFALPYAILKYNMLRLLPWEELCKIVLGEFMHPLNSGHWQTSPGTELDYAATYEKMIQLPPKDRSCRTMLDIIYRHSSVKPVDGLIWGDKTPELTKHIAYVLPVFPAAKYVFLVRDGRDVVSSYMRAPKELVNDNANLTEACNIWNNSIDAWELVKKKIPKSRRLEIRYEKLCAEPHDTLSGLCKFLGVSFVPEMLDFQDMSDQMGATGMAHHANLNKPLFTKSVGAWKTRLSEEDIVAIEAAIGTNLKRLHYT